MRSFRLVAIVALAVPAIAAGQVGPNPAVSGGSQDPTVGGSTDTTTAPQDARIGDRATGNVLDRTIDTTTTAPADISEPSGATTGTTTETTTKTPTKPMRNAPKRR